MPSRGVQPASLLRRLLACFLLLRDVACKFCQTTNCSHILTTAAQRLDYVAYQNMLSLQKLSPQLAMRSYFQDWWHPGRPHGAACAELERVGAAGGEAGKALCDPEQLFAAPTCHVVSVGSNGDAAFETDVLGRAPHCRIETFDGTLIGERQALRANLPSAVEFHDENWGSQSWRRFKGREVTLLKIDCEGCELAALLNFVARVPTRQIVMEVHGCLLAKSRSVQHTFASGSSDPLTLVGHIHHLMYGLYSAGYRVFANEPNILFSDGTCLEVSLLHVNATMSRRHGGRPSQRGPGVGVPQ